MHSSLLKDWDRNLFYFFSCMCSFFFFFFFFRRTTYLIPRNKMSRYVRERSFSHVLPTKTQISLRIRAVWSESSLSAWESFAQWRFWSDCANAQADLNIPSRKHAYIMLTPLKPHFYIVKLGFTGVYIIFLISAQKHRLWVIVRTASSRWFLRVPTIYVLSRNVKNIRIFYLKIFIFWW